MEAPTRETGQPGRLGRVAEQQGDPRLVELDLAEVLDVPLGAGGRRLPQRVTGLGDEPCFEKDPGPVQQSHAAFDLDPHSVRAVHQGEGGGQVAAQELHVAQVVHGGELEARLAGPGSQVGATLEVLGGLVELHELGLEHPAVEQQLGLLVQGQQVHTLAGPVHPGEGLGEVAAAAVHRRTLHVAQADQVEPVDRLGLLDRAGQDLFAGRQTTLLEGDPALGQGQPGQGHLAARPGELVRVAGRDGARPGQQPGGPIGAVAGDLRLGSQDVAFDSVQCGARRGLCGVWRGRAH